MIGPYGSSRGNGLLLRECNAGHRVNARIVMIKHRDAQMRITAAGVLLAVPTATTDNLNPEMDEIRSMLLVLNTKFWTSPLSAPGHVNKINANHKFPVAAGVGWVNSRVHE